MKKKTTNRPNSTSVKGRGPQKKPTKVQVTLRLDNDVIEKFRRTGPGWQSRINQTLLEFVRQRSS